MQIKLDPLVTEFKNLDNMRDTKIKGPASNIHQWYQVPFFTYNTFFYYDSMIFYKSRGKLRKLSPNSTFITDRGEDISIEYKVLHCVLTKHKVSRIFVTENSFIFNQVLEEKIRNYLFELSKREKNIFETIVSQLGNRVQSGAKIEKDAKLVAYFLMASDSYASQIEEIMVDYELFRNIMFVETVL